MAIYKLNSAFPFQELKLSIPHTQNDQYIFKLNINRAPVYIQFPIATSKQGIRIVKQKHFLDINYDTAHMNTIQSWIELFQSRCIDLVMDQKLKLFSKELNQPDLIRMMTPVSRPYTDDCNFIRVGLDTIHTGDLSCIIYDEHKNIIQDYRIITPEHSFIPLLLFEGITITPTSFTINIKAIQMMVYEPVSKDVVFLIDNEDAPPAIYTKDESFSESEDEPDEIDDQNILNEICRDISDSNVLVLKSPKDEYLEKYKEALIHARKLKQEALDAHFIAVQIKSSYNLEDIDVSDY